MEKFFKNNYTILEEDEEVSDPIINPIKPKKSNKKQKRRRIFLNSNIEVETHELDITDEEKTCIGCGKQLVFIGYEITSEIIITPLTIKRIIYKKKKYACKDCEGADIDPSTKKGPVVTAKLERFYPKSIFGVLAIVFFIIAKFIDCLPYYRIEEILRRNGAHISRQIISDAIIYTYKRLLPFFELMKEKLRTLHFLNCDETRFRLLHDKDKKPFNTNIQLWGLCGGRDFPLVCYFPGDRSASTFAQIIGEEFEGVIQTDGWGAYVSHCNSHPKVIHVGCWAHVQRKFTEALKSEKDPVKRQAILEGELGKFLGPIKTLFHVEAELRALNLSDEEFVARRKKILLPILNTLYGDAKIVQKETEVQTRPVTGPVNYMLGQWNILVRYLDYAALTPSNNDAENIMRSVVVNRKNSLFFNSWEGAEAGAMFMSFVATAKLYGFNPHDWLVDLLNRFPRMEREGRLEELLPWNWRTLDVESDTVSSCVSQPACTAAETTKK